MCFFPLLKYLNEANYENVIAIQIGLTEQTLNAIEKVSLEHMDHYNAIISGESCGQMLQSWTQTKPNRNLIT